MDPTVRVAEGLLRGSEREGVFSFKGIPYAAAPIGAGRFAAPSPAPEWPGLREALDYGPTATRRQYTSPFDKLVPEPVIAGADYLNLNVWTPGLDTERRPVLVWIHGGYFSNGSGAVSQYDGSRFAQHGVVCITMNYRLGAEGFLFVEGAPANRGLLDQVAALRWVRANVEAFGGDPKRVTIAGESAGGSSVATLMTMPGAAGLFRRAIAQSGAGHNAQSIECAARVTAALSQALGVEPTVEGICSVPVDELMAAETALAVEVEAKPEEWGEVGFDQMPFEPVVDGDVVPARPIDRMNLGVGAEVDLLIGTTAEEMAGFFVPTGFADIVDDEMLRAFLDDRGVDADAAVSTYRTCHAGGTPGELLIDALTDFDFRIPAVRAAEARRKQNAATYVYEFCWKSPQFGGRLGAAHFLDVSFVFDTLDDPAAKPLLGDAPPQALADEMHGAWVAFVMSGDPGWEAYGPARTVHQFGLSSVTVCDPRAQQRHVWDGVR